MKSLSAMQKLTIVLIPVAVLALMLGALACSGKGATSTSTSTPTPAALFLKVTAPADESAVSSGNITVSGVTIPGAVVSISVGNNTQIANVDQKGNFEAVVPLEEGPNQIDVVASDQQQGNEQSSTVTVMMYAP
jgi:ABC-type glycerol-3-phosphate transport system substrate-binding protein